MMSRLRVEPLLAAIALCVAAAGPALADAGATATPSPAATASGPGVGAVAPKVALQSVLDGKVQSFDLQAAAAQKPIVLYFFSKAFTTG